MDQRKTKAFFEGRDIHAYNIFGAHLEGDGVRFLVDLTCRGTDFPANQTGNNGYYAGNGY